MAKRPVSATTTTKAGLDISVLAGVSLNPVVALGLGLDPASTKAAGIAKAANLFYKILFTPRGSNPLNPQEGTSLLNLYQSGLSEIDALYVDVRDAVSAALEQVIEYQGRAGVPTTERLTSVNVASFEVDRQRTALDFSVNIYVASGEKATFEIPSVILA